MKISYRTHPVLEYFKPTWDGKLKIRIGEESIVQGGYEIIRSEFLSLRKGFGSDIKYLTKPLVQAVDKAQRKLTELFQREGTEYRTGTIMYDRGLTVCYELEGCSGYADVNCKIFLFLRDELLGYLHVFPNEGKIRSLFMRNPGVDHAYKSWMYFFQYAIVATLFIEFAEVQTKELPPKSRVKDITCKYINESSSLVKIIDSTWFTNLVKSDAFNVRGHFRLQPKKNEQGEWTKELIWINEFQKSGYTRRAGIIIEQHNQATGSQNPNRITN